MVATSQGPQEGRALQGSPLDPPIGPSALAPRLEPAPGRLQLRRHSHEVPVAGGTVLFPVAVLEDGYGWGERGQGWDGCRAL